MSPRIRLGLAVAVGFALGLGVAQVGGQRSSASSSDGAAWEARVVRSPGGVPRLGPATVTKLIRDGETAWKHPTGVGPDDAIVHVTLPLSDHRWECVLAIPPVE